LNNWDKRTDAGGSAELLQAFLNVIHVCGGNLVLMEKRGWFALSVSFS